MPDHPDPWVLVLTAPDGRAVRLAMDGECMLAPGTIDPPVPVHVLAEALTQSAAARNSAPGTPWGRVSGWEWRIDESRVGDAGVRDPDSPCEDFDPQAGEPGDLRGCETDGHYLCQRCRWRKPEGDDDA